MKSKINDQKSNSKHAFTLIELLVVIAIIGILLSLLFPALSAARHRARITRAKMEMNQIEFAWISYRNDYRTLPTGLSEMGSEAISILTGDNPRSITYMEFPDDNFVDPWGEVYGLDLGDNSGVSGEIRVGRNRIRYDLSRPVAVWSIGSGDVITSWDSRD